MSKFTPEQIKRMEANAPGMYELLVQISGAIRTLEAPLRRTFDHYLDTINNLLTEIDGGE